MRGGKRANAGRPKGGTGKRKRELIEKAQEGGLMPLDYMLAVMRDVHNAPDRRDDMAKSAAPYLHARLAAATVEHKGGITINISADDAKL